MTPRRQTTTKDSTPTVAKLIRRTLPILQETTLLSDKEDVISANKVTGAGGEEIPPWARELRRVYREDIARVCDVTLSTAGDGGRVADRLLALAKAALED